MQNPRKRQSCQWRPPINQPHAHLLIHLNTLALPSKHFPVFLNLPISSPLRSLNRTLPIRARQIAPCGLFLALDESPLSVDRVPARRASRTSASLCRQLYLDIINFYWSASSSFAHFLVVCSFAFSLEYYYYYVFF